MKKGLVDRQALSDDAIDELRIYKADILKLLSDEQKSKLNQIDRYVTLRRFGLAKYLELFFPESDITESDLRLIRETEKKIWQESVIKADELWLRFLNSFSKHLEADKELSQWFELRRELFESPFYADFSILELADRGKQTSYPVSGDFETFENIAGTVVTYHLTRLGNWEKQIVEDKTQVKVSLNLPTNIGPLQKCNSDFCLNTTATSLR